MNLIEKQGPKKDIALQRVMNIKMEKKQLSNIEELCFEHYINYRENFIKWCYKLRIKPGTMFDPLLEKKFNTTLACQEVRDKVKEYFASLGAFDYRKSGYSATMAINYIIWEKAAELKLIELDDPNPFEFYIQLLEMGVYMYGLKGEFYFYGPSMPELSYEIINMGRENAQGIAKAVQKFIDENDNDEAGEN